MTSKRSPPTLWAGAYRASRSRPAKDGRPGGKQHLLDPARDREVEVELLALDLQAQGLRVVERERGLLGQRLHQRALRLGEQAVVDRVRDGEHAEEALAELHRDRDHRAHGEVRVVVLHDPGVAGRVRDQLAAAGLGDPAGDPLPDRELLGPEHLLDELGAGGQLALHVVGERPVGREEPLHGHAAHRVGGRPLEDARR